MKKQKITVHLQDAMDARIVIERAGMNVIFSQSIKDNVTFSFRCSGKKLDRLMLLLKATGITPIVDPPYTNKTIKTVKSRLS